MESPKRRLSAVWFADIVGYSTPSERDEPAALRLVTTLQTLSGEIVPQFEGRIVKFIGDAVLSEFASSDSALRSAVTLQERYVAATAALGVESRLRIGVHVGEVNATPDGDLYGDGINMAARLHQKAAPGQVIISEDVWRLLRARPEFRFERLGEVELKGITTRVGIYDVLFGARAALDGTRALSGGGRATGAGPRRTAVWIAAAAVILLAGVAGIYTFVSDPARDRRTPVPGQPPAARPAERLEPRSANPRMRAADGTPGPARASTPSEPGEPPPSSAEPAEPKAAAPEPAAPKPSLPEPARPEPSLKDPAPTDPASKDPVLSAPPPSSSPDPDPVSLDAAGTAAIHGLLNRLAAALTSEHPQQAMPTLGPGGDGRHEGLGPDEGHISATGSQ